jgi:hypothetical protein
MILQPNCSTLVGKLPSDIEAEKHALKSFVKEWKKSNPYSSWKKNAELYNKNSKDKDDWKYNIEKKEWEHEGEQQFWDNHGSDFESINIDTSSSGEGAIPRFYSLLKKGTISNVEDLEWENSGGGGHWDFVNTCFEVAKYFFDNKFDVTDEEMEEIESVFSDSEGFNYDAFNELIECLNGDITPEFFDGLKAKYGENVNKIVKVFWRMGKISKKNNLIVHDWLLVQDI